MENADSYSFQQQVVVHLSDGSDFSLEKWKLMQSSALCKDYVRREKIQGDQVKNMALLYSTINKEEMQLYSSACDIDPGEPFRKHFYGLSPENQKKLLIVAGKYGEKGERKLNSSVLTVQLTDVYFPEDMIHKNIKPLMEPSVWMNHCLDECAKKVWSFLHRPLVGDEMRKFTDMGSFYKVPSSLACGVYDGINSYDFCKVKDESVVLHGIKKIANSSAFYYLFLPGEPKNQLLINFLDEAENGAIIEHDDELKGYACSKSGEYLLSYSKKMVNISKITSQNHDQPCISSASIPVIGSVINAVWNNQDTAFLVSSFDRNSSYSSWAIWRVDNGNYQKMLEMDSEQIGTVYHMEFTDDGKRLITSSVGDEGECKITVWNTEDIEAIFPLKTLSAGPILRSACSPANNEWAIFAQDGNILFVTEKDDSSDSIVQLPDFKPSGKFNAHLVYSPNERLIAVSHAAGKGIVVVYLYNAISKENIARWFVPSGLQGIGFTPDSSELIMVFNDRQCSKIELISQDNKKILNYLLFQTSLQQLALLRKLYKANQNRNKLTLYTESNDYRAFQPLPKEHRDFLNDYLFGKNVIVKNNIKEFVEMMSDVGSVARSWLKDAENLFKAGGKG